MSDQDAMGNHRDTPGTREAQNQVARDLVEKAHAMGNTDYTFEDAQSRVRDACRKGDQKRLNGNR